MLRYRNIDDLTALFVWEWQSYAYGLLLVLNCAFFHALCVSCAR